MPFTPTDMYFASGSSPLRNCWTQDVTKFDTSSFYNWEEDNQPVHDLEERTYLNWEKLGFPTSSLPGMVLTVSADAGVFDTLAACHTKIFTDLSSAVASLPERITFPVTIEVGSHGDLGGVEINGIDFGPSGSLEIVNRNMWKAYSSIAQASAISTDTRYVSYDLISHVSAVDLSTTFSEASCMDISTTVLSGQYDTRTEGNVRSVIQFPGNAPGVNLATLNHTRLSVSIDSGNNAFETDASTLQLPPYEENAGLGSELLGDCSTIDAITGGQANIGNLFNYAQPVDHAIVGSVYGNYLRHLTVEGCNGPVFIRGFFVDGHSSEKNGVTIRNSNDVLLENMAAVRCTENGYFLEDSTVVATRGLVGYRCYGFESGTIRKNPEWYTVSADGPTNNDPAAGLHLVNSHLTLSSTQSLEPTESNVRDFYFNFSRCSNGIVLENSVVDGGSFRSNVLNAATTMSLDIELSPEWGMRCINSVWDVDGRLRVTHNSRGVLAENSTFYIDEMEGVANQHIVFKGVGSRVVYNKRGLQYSDLLTRYVSTQLQQMHFFANGQDFNLIDTEMDHQDVSSIDTSFGRWITYYNFGMNPMNYNGDQQARLPSMQLTRSTARLSHFGSIQKGIVGVQTLISDGMPVYGACLNAKDGSQATFLGSKYSSTIIAGSEVYENANKVAGVYAGRNSNVEFNGPTAISKFGVGVLAEDNSVMTFGPPRRKSDGGVDLSCIDLTDNENHTSVEIHATKACLVANRGSVINIKDVGDFAECWVSGTNGQSVLASGVTLDTSGELNSAPYTSAGSFQFYPNPNDAGDYNVSGGGDESAGREDVLPNSVTTLFNINTFSQETDHNRWNYYLTDHIFNPASQNDVSAWTGGGVCVRAVNGSKVNVQNVNFPTGWWNPSGAIYDTSTGELCDRLFIWNIADNSEMHASYVAVSGLHPVDAGYHGPSGVWGSGTNNAAVAYGAPSATPDTSSLSVLDVYGQTVGDVLIQRDGAGTHPFGPQAFENFGPFRIYVSPQGYTHYLTNADPSIEDIYGAPHQIFAQGYQASANLSAAPSVSSLFDEIVDWNTDGDTLITSKFFYTSSVLAGNAPQRIQLDKSAANAFANAKHGSSGKSGRHRICTIYDAHQQIGGTATPNASKSLGRGYKDSNAFDLGRDE